jgi:hypothetical protein
MAIELIELMPVHTPEYMAPAWISCLHWAAGKQEVVTAYRKETGDNYKPSLVPIEQMIDQATGRQEAFLRSFVGWFNQSIWGPMDGPPASLTDL